MIQLVLYLRKFGCLLAALLLVVTAAGCTSERAEPQRELPKLRIMLKAGEAFRSQNNLFLKEIEEKLGMQIEILTPPSSSYRERVNVVMASGDMPDIIQLDWFGEGNFAAWAEKGLLQPIHIGGTKHLIENVPSKVLAMMKVGSSGLVYGIPGVTLQEPPYGAIVRKDWLDALRLGLPVTLEQYEQVLEAFVTQDPDRNGKHDTIGFTSWRLNDFGGVFGSAFAMDYMWNSLHADPLDPKERAKLREEQIGYMDFIDFARKAYERNWLDKQFYQVQNKNLKFLQGNVGMTGGSATSVLELEKDLQRQVPTARLEWIPAPRDSLGKAWNFAPDSYGFGGAGSVHGAGAVFVITKHANYDAAIRFLDEMNSREMILLSSLGLKGIHYESFDPYRKLLVRTKEQNETAKRELFRVSDAYRGERLVSLGAEEAENDRLYVYERYGQIVTTNPPSFHMSLLPEAVRFYQQHPDFRERERQMAVRYVMGLLPRDEYLAYLKQENVPMRRELAATAAQRFEELVRASRP